jgi:hypothetical protein
MEMLMSRCWPAFAVAVLTFGCRGEPSASPSVGQPSVKEKQVVLILNADLDVDMRVMEMSPCPLRLDFVNDETGGSLHETLILQNEKGTITFFKDGKQQAFPERLLNARYYWCVYDYRPASDRLAPVSVNCNEKLPLGTKFREIRLLGEIEKKAEHTVQLKDGGTLTGESNGRYKVYEAKAMMP